MIYIATISIILFVIGVRTYMTAIAHILKKKNNENSKS